MLNSVRCPTPGLDQTSSYWWVEVSAAVLAPTYHLGPFSNREAAKVARAAHVAAFDNSELSRQAVSIKQR